RPPPRPDALPISADQDRGPGVISLRRVRPEPLHSLADLLGLVVEPAALGRHALRHVLVARALGDDDLDLPGRDLDALPLRPCAGAHVVGDRLLADGDARHGHLRPPGASRSGARRTAPHGPLPRGPW